MQIIFEFDGEYHPETAGVAIYNCTDGPPFIKNRYVIKDEYTQYSRGETHIYTLNACPRNTCTGGGGAKKRIVWKTGPNGGKYYINSKGSKVYKK